MRGEKLEELPNRQPARLSFYRLAFEVAGLRLGAVSRNIFAAKVQIVRSLVSRDAVMSPGTITRR